MPVFLLNRIAQGVVTLLIVSLFGFLILHLAPGGPLSQYASIPGMTAEQIARISHQMGLDRPLPVQYLDWLTKMVTGDWGRSYRDGQPVIGIIASHLGATLLLMGSATVIAIGLGCWIGMKSAVAANSPFDHVATLTAMVFLSIPTFWLGLVAIYIFSLRLGWLPAGNMYSYGDGSIGDIALHLIMPSFVLGLVSVAVWSRYMRTAVLDVLGQDFVRTARAKGVPPGRLLRRHVLRNAMLPMITLAGLQLPILLSGALVTETVFTWPGMGRLFLDSLNYKDYPVIMGLLMFSAILVILGSLVADLAVAAVDPRIRAA